MGCSKRASAFPCQTRSAADKGQQGFASLIGKIHRTMISCGSGSSASRARLYLPRGVRGIRQRSAAGGHRVEEDRHARTLANLRHQRLRIGIQTQESDFVCQAFVRTTKHLRSFYIPRRCLIENGASDRTCTCNLLIRSWYLCGSIVSR
jgi:hypothetical protein